MLKKTHLIKYIKNTKSFKLNKKKIKKTTVRIKKNNFKLKKKWRFWRGFKQFFINKKKITFYKKLQWNYNEKRLAWHQMAKTYLFNIKHILRQKRWKNKKYSQFLKHIELRLTTILIRSRFYTKLINSYEGIKKNLLLVNGIIINTTRYILSILDLYQKRRQKRNRIINKNTNYKRYTRLKWRKFRWKKARYIFWKIRRISHFNLYLNKKINSSLNYLEINYKIPAGVLIKQPFMKEFIINRQTNIINHKILKKIFFTY